LRKGDFWLIFTTENLSSEEEEIVKPFNCFFLEVPLLRKRKEDIPLLLCKFVDRCNQKFHKNVERISLDG
jgi:DNA-binding NtrC family response regulator